MANEDTDSFNGKVIAPVASGKTPGRRVVNELVTAANSLGTIEIKMTDKTTGKVVRCASKTILEIPKGGGGSGSGGGGSGTDPGAGNSWMKYRGTYDPGISYSGGDVVRVRTGTPKGIWICVTASGHPLGGPTYPEPADTGGTNDWEILALGIAKIDVCNGGSDTQVDCNIAI